jgi:hypothetical protein
VLFIALPDVDRTEHAFDRIRRKRGAQFSLRRRDQRLSPWRKRKAPGPIPC